MWIAEPGEEGLGVPHHLSADDAVALRNRLLNIGLNATDNDETLAWLRLAGVLAPLRRPGDALPRFRAVHSHR